MALHHSSLSLTGSEDYSVVNSDGEYGHHQEVLSPITNTHCLPLYLLQAMASTIFFPRRKLQAFISLIFLLSTITLFVTPLCMLVFEHYHANQLSQQNRQPLRDSQQDPLPRFPLNVLHDVQYMRRQRIANIQCLPVCRILCIFFSANKLGEIFLFATA